jgi:uncharacterized SAM-binding protein YcdF (DUF218 family)/lysophospholipase L1-like esterase
VRFFGTIDRRFLLGAICGVATVFGCRSIINETTIPDRILAPLLLQDSSASADAIVVLGGGIIGDCVLNLNSVRRAVRGARLFKEGRAPVLVLTGGMAGGACPVADGMHDLIRELGVPSEHILVERQSRSTWENAVMTAPLLRTRNLQRILLVTDRLHMRRASGVFARQGFIVEPSAVPVYEGHLDNVSMLSAGIREAAALAYYRMRRWTADRPAGIQELGTENAALPVDRAVFQGETASGAPIVVLGASYAANWKLAAIGGVPVVNAGVTGEQSFEMLARFDRDVVAVHPRAVILWGFINDIFRAEDMERTLARVRTSYREMIIRAHEAEIEPILATEVTIRAPKRIVDTAKATVGWLLGASSYQDRINSHVAAMNQWLRETAQRDGLLVLDLQRELGDGDGPRRWAYSVEDGSHISEEGYRVLTDYAVPILRRKLGLPGRP